MSGHSHWATIKHKKAKEDAKKGKKFTKLIKEITIAARTGGGDTESNARLRLLLDKAKEINMPQENSSRAIKKGTGELPGQSYEAYLYEGYGPSGIAVVLEVLTDNKNRAISDLRAVFSRKGGTIADSGAVSWMFERLGVIRIPVSSIEEDKLFEELLEHDVKDVITAEEYYEVFTDPKLVEDIKAALKKAGLTVEEAEVEWVPKNTIELDEEAQAKAYEFLSAIQDLDDVEEVYTNVA